MLPHIGPWGVYGAKRRLANGICEREKAPTDASAVGARAEREGLGIGSPLSTSLEDEYP